MGREEVEDIDWDTLSKPVQQEIIDYRQRQFQRPTTAPTVIVPPTTTTTTRKPRKAGIPRELRDKLVELRRGLKTLSKWARFTNDKESTYYRPQNLELWEALAALEEVLK